MSNYKRFYNEKYKYVFFTLDYSEIIRLIKYKHYEITPINWKFSSFKKFVGLNLYPKDWCNFDDKNKINKLDFE